MPADWYRFIRERPVTIYRKINNGPYGATDNIRTMSRKPKILETQHEYGEINNATQKS
ncbi:hypothetical protein FM107_12185 [Sphingobacterium sp. JB170]|nr:hypothetical protein FM107_12185 [Sphingobacterium sp. JB170]